MDHSPSDCSAIPGYQPAAVEAASGPAAEVAADVRTAAEGVEVAAEARTAAEDVEVVDNAESAVAAAGGRPVGPDNLVVAEPADTKVVEKP
jgi:hypothetical protein